MGGLNVWHDEYYASFVEKAGDYSVLLEKYKKAYDNLKLAIAGDLLGDQSPYCCYVMFGSYGVNGVITIG